MIIAFHSVLILDKETFFYVYVGSHYNFTNVSRKGIIVHPTPLLPPPPEKKRKNSFTVSHKDKQSVFQESRYDMSQKSPSNPTCNGGLTEIKETTSLRL